MALNFTRLIFVIGIFVSLAFANTASAQSVSVRDLWLGSMGEDVKSLQIFLNQNGFKLGEVGPGSPGNETTFFGQATKASLIKFQIYHNISPSVGYYGPITRSVIAKFLNQASLPTILKATSINTTVATSTIVKKKNHRGGGRNRNNDDDEEVVVELPDTTAPALPTSLSVSAGDATSNLSWIDPTDSDLSYISIYRGTTTGNLSLLATTTVGSRSYNDVPLHNDTTYHYALTSTDISGNESAKTSEASTTPLGIFDIYVDSVNGSDSNDGTSDYEAYQTLAAAETAALAEGNGVRIGLKRGSHWRESLTLNSLSSVTIQGYGSSGDLPMIDGGEVVSSWSKSAGYTNVYETSFVPQVGSGRITVVEDNSFLTRRTSIALVDANPGSWYGSSLTATSTIYIHASDSSNPSTSGKVYEASKRLYGVNMVDSNGAIIDKVAFSQAFSLSGIFRLGHSLNASQVFTHNGGGYHHVYFEGGTLSDFIAYGNDPATSGTSNEMLVVFSANPGSYDVLYDRVGVLLPDNQFNYANGIYSHAQVGSPDYNSITYRQSWGKNISSFTGNAHTMTIEGSYVTNGSLGRANSITNRGVAKYNQVKIASAPGPKNFFTPLGIGWGIEDSVFQADSTGGVGILFDSSVPLIIERSIIETGADNIIDYTGSFSTTTLEISNSVLKGRNFYYYYDLPAGYDFDGDYNIYVLDSLGGFKNRIGGNEYTSLVSWRTATGADTNSITITQAQFNSLFPNKASGDWTMADIGVTFVDGTPLTEAGPQYHWDWNDRQAEVGPPTSWPNVPDTLAESKEYVLDPDSWDF